MIVVMRLCQAAAFLWAVDTVALFYGGIDDGWRGEEQISLSLIIYVSPPRLSMH